MPANAEPIANADSLQAHLDDADLTLIQVESDRVTYAAAHLPSAIYPHGYDDFTTERDDVRALVRLPHELASMLGRMGIDENQQIVRRDVLTAELVR